MSIDLAKTFAEMKDTYRKAINNDQFSEHLAKDSMDRNSKIRTYFILSIYLRMINTYGRESK
jgi:hypothetical protein